MPSGRAPPASPVQRTNTVTSSPSHGRQDEAALLILTGPHAQVAVPLRQGPNTVGADPGSDVVLADALMAPSHFTLRRADAAIRLLATGGPVSLGGTTVGLGESAPCRDGMTFQAGDTAFQLTGVSPAAAARRRASRPAVFATAAALAVIVLVFLALSAGARQGAAPPLASATAAAARPAVAADALHALQERLAAANLGVVALTALADGSVEARGEIMPQQMPAWHEQQHWFDGAFGGRAVLVNQVTASAAAPPLAIQAVWPGPHPYVIDGAGQKLFTGAALRSGWTVERIEADCVLIRRGGQTLAVRF